LIHSDRTMPAVESRAWSTVLAIAAVIVLLLP
jgi:hypothetical protein